MTILSDQIHLFAADEYVFVERPPLLAFAADRISYEGHSRVLPCHTGSYRVINIGHKHAKIDRRGVQNTVSFKQVSRVVKVVRSNMDITSETKTNADSKPAKEAPNEEKRNSYIVGTVIGYEN